jgi:hypothetical protein
MGNGGLAKIVDFGETGAEPDRGRNLLGDG